MVLQPKHFSPFTRNYHAYLSLPFHLPFVPPRIKVGKYFGKARARFLLFAVSPKRVNYKREKKKGKARTDGRDELRTINTRCGLNAESSQYFKSNCWYEQFRILPHTKMQYDSE